jgi:hypothetical protein
LYIQRTISETFIGNKRFKTTWFLKASTLPERKIIMKKFFIKLTALLIIAASLLSSGCDLNINISGSTTSLQTLPSGTDAQSSTKYPSATIPSQSTTQKPPVTEVVGGTTEEEDAEMKMLITEKYLTIHPNSRPGYLLTELKSIVVHYVANPNTSALQNWKYFENKNNASAHFIIDLDGNILQCMPLDEVAWAIGTQEGNYTTISIECCHPDKTGKFTDATYESLVKLVSWLCKKYGLTADQVKRHYDYPRQNGWQKPCPLYFVDHPEEWEQFKSDLTLP